MKINREALERSLEERGERWWCVADVTRLLVDQGMDPKGAYWIALGEARRLEREGKAERFNPSPNHFFEWWRWSVAG